MSELLSPVVKRAENPDAYYDSFQLPAEWKEAITSTNFEEAGRVHDWRNHVHWLAIEFWGQLDEASRLLIYLQAHEDASNERWD